MSILTLTKDTTGISALIKVGTKDEIPNPAALFEKGGYFILLSIEDSPCSVRPVHVKCPKIGLSKAKKWVKLNKDILLDYWDGNITPNELLPNLKRLV